MKPITLLLSATLLAAGATGALADQPGKDWMSLDRAYKHLTEAGYQNAAEMEADDDHWEARAMKDGVWFEVKVDPRSGAVTAKPKSH